MHVINRKHLGLTLIELVITLAILAILTAVAVPAYKGYIAESRKIEGRNNLAALKLAEEEFFLENNSYFDGSDADALKTNSNNLWVVQANDDGQINFDYSVTLSGGGYVAKAKGKGTKVPTSVELVVTKQ
jgi:type IV pilus assembly protein PilE